MSTVLLIDDDAQFRGLMASALTQRGQQVVHAASGAEGRAALGKQRVDVIALDGLLPDGDGMRWIPELRAMNPDAPIVFVSSFFKDMASYRRLKDELRVAAIAHKPLSPERFVMQVEAALTEAQAPATNEAQGRQPFATNVGATLSAWRAEYAAGLDTAIDALAEALDKVRATPGPDTWVAAHQLAHKMHGTAGSYGFQRVSAAAAAVEGALVGWRERSVAAVQAWRTIDQAVIAARKAARGDVVQAPGSRGPTVLLVGGDHDTARELARLGVAKGFQLVRMDAPAAMLERAKGSAPAAVLFAGDLASVAPAISSLRNLPGCGEVPVGVITRSAHHAADSVHAGVSVVVRADRGPVEIATGIERLLTLGPNRTRVLLVDDDPAFGELVGQVLSSHGIELRQVRDGVDLDASLAEVLPDLVMLDFELNGASGLDVLKRIRSTPRWADLPVLMITAHTEVDRRVAAFRAGADDYLGKPVVNEELLARVELRVERARMLRERADRDALTGLLLRRAFCEDLSRCLAVADRRNEALAVCIIDLDHFKQVNDTHGHLAGDRVLAAFGRLVSTRLRSEDLRGRWGGEEFVVALPGASAEVAREVLKRLAAEFARLEFTGDDGKTFHASFSAGVAAYDADGKSAQALLGVADQRLYAIKRSRRGHVA